MKVCELYATNPDAVRFGLCIKGLKSGVPGVIVPPFSTTSDFDATAHFFHDVPNINMNGYGHFFFDDCTNEVILDADGQPVYQEVPELN